MITKTSFIKATHHQFNEIREFNGLLIGNVGWHTGHEWKVVDTKDFDVIAERDYKPVAEFHLREDLWSYVKKELEKNKND